MVEKPRWLFVSGAARTGMTLLAWCLAQHPAVAMCVHESNLAPKLLRLFDPLPGETVGPLEWRCGEAVYEETCHLICQAADGSLEHDPADLARAALRGILKSLAAGRMYAGDKSPAYTMTWPLLRELCPGCEIVFIERDIEPTIASWIRVGFGSHPEAIREEIERRVASARECPGAHWVKLEELEVRPREVLGELLVGLGLDPEALPWGMVEAQIGGTGRVS